MIIDNPTTGVGGGGGSISPTLSTQSISHTGSGTNTVWSYYRFNADGTVETRDGEGASYSYDHDWCDDAASVTGSDFEIAYSSLSGTTDGSMTTSYLDLGSARTIGVSRNAMETTGTESGSATVTIREISDTGNSDSASYSWSATWP